MVALSHVLWTTGRVLPLPEIAEAAHAVGALVLVDGAQSAGQLDLRMEDTGADFYADLRPEVAARARTAPARSG